MRKCECTQSHFSLKLHLNGLLKFVPVLTRAAVFVRDAMFGSHCMQRVFAHWSLGPLAPRRSPITPDTCTQRIDNVSFVRAIWNVNIILNGEDWIELVLWWLFCNMLLFSFVISCLVWDFPFRYWLTLVFLLF